MAPFIWANQGQKTFYEAKLNFGICLGKIEPKKSLKSILGLNFSSKNVKITILGLNLVCKSQKFYSGT